MAPITATIPPATALELHGLITPTAHGIASRVLAKTAGGNVTLFAFDAGQGLTEHTSSFDALVLVLEGALTLTIGGTAVRATPGSIVHMPADVAHAVDAPEAARMLLIMLRGRTEGGA
jgi:quercetin dioxygenase-like cupin family protein